MKRKEQIEQAAENFAGVNYDIETESDSFYHYVQKEAFSAGAEWSDEHPDLYSVTRKAVERERKHLIDKIYQWLDENTEDYTECIYDSDTDDYDDEDNLHFAIASKYDYKKDFMEALRKAMEQ